MRLCMCANFRIPFSSSIYDDVKKLPITNGEPWCCPRLVDKLVKTVRSVFYRALVGAVGPPAVGISSRMVVPAEGSPIRRFLLQGKETGRMETLVLLRAVVAKG